MAAMATLGKLAEPRHVAEMLPAVLKAGNGPEREAAEKAVMFVCNGSKDADKRADPLLAALDKLGDDERTALMPLLGRVGGPAARKTVNAAMADRDPRRREAGFRAMCNWPDASVAATLLDLVQTAGDREHQTAALRALIRVAALPDGRSNEERLDLLKRAMTLAARDQERNLVLAASAAIRTMESLHFVTPFLEQPALAQQAHGTAWSSWPIIAIFARRTRPSSTGPSTRCFASAIPQGDRSRERTKRGGRKEGEYSMFVRLRELSWTTSALIVFVLFGGIARAEKTTRWHALTFGRISPWADAVFGPHKVKLAGGGWWPAVAPPFSFAYDGKTSETLLPSWKQTAEKNQQQDGPHYVTTWLDAKTGLKVVATATVFDDFPAVDWISVSRTPARTIRRSWRRSRRWTLS